MKKMLLALLMMFAFAFNASADKLGPNVHTLNLYGAPALTVIGNATEPTGILGVKKSWYPVDFVAEAVVRTDPSLNLMLAKNYGGGTFLGGVSIQEDASGLGLVGGVDYKRFLVRIGAYTTDVSNCSRHRCRTSTENRTALTVGYRFPLGGK